MKSMSILALLRELFLGGLTVIIRGSPLAGFEVILRQLSREQSDLSKQVTEAADSLQQSAQLVTSLERTLKDRAAKLEALKVENDRLSSLIQVNEQQAKAFLDKLGSLLDRRKTAERWVAFLINLAAGLILFVIGVVASDSVKSVIAKVFSYASTISPIQ